MDNKFTVTPKQEFREDKSVTMTIRINLELRDRYDALSIKSNRSRNELINMALQYAIDNLNFIENK